MKETKQETKQTENVRRHSQALFQGDDIIWVVHIISSEST